MTGAKFENLGVKYGTVSGYLGKINSNFEKMSEIMAKLVAKMFQ